MTGLGWHQTVALARHAARQAGTGRGAAVALVAAIAAAAVALGLPVANPADAPLIATGAALAAAAAAAGIAAAVGSATALAPSAELAAVATTPVGRGRLAGGTLLGVAAGATAAALLAFAGGAVPGFLAGGTARTVVRWNAAAAVTGATASRGDPAVRWTAPGMQPLTVDFPAILSRDHPEAGPIRIRLRVRVALAAAPGTGDAMAAEPVIVAAGPAGALQPLPAPAGNPWGPEGLAVTVPRARVGTDGRLQLQIRTESPGLRLGLRPADARVALVPGTLGGVYLRGALGLIPALLVVALAGAVASTVCSRGVSLMAGLGTALVLGLAPLAREALIDLPVPSGLLRTLALASHALLAVLPQPAGGVGACLAGEDLPWSQVGWSAVTHLPAAAACCIAAWLLVRRRDW